MDKAAEETQGKAPAPAAQATVEESSTSVAQEVRVGLSTPRFRVPSVMLAAVGVVAVLVAAYLVYRLMPVLALIFTSILFATAIEPVVSLLRRGPFSRSAGILVVYTGIFLTLGLIGFLTIPVFLNQIGELGTALPERFKELREGADGIESPFVRQQVISIIGAGDAIVGSFTRPSEPTSDPEKVATAAEATLSIAEALFAFITFFVVAFYWLSERTLIKRSITSWLTSKRAARVRHVWDEIEEKVGGWVRGQLTLMLMVGLVSAVGYFLLGVKYWPAMAVFIALCEAIPLVGPYVGTAPAVLVALTQSGNDGLPALLGMGDFGPLTRALLVVAFAVVLQTIEGNVLVPRVMRNSVGVSALTVVISLLIGAALAGLLGALLAVPIAGSLQVILADMRAAHEIEEKAAAVADAASDATRDEVAVVVSTPRGGAPKPEAQGNV